MAGALETVDAHHVDSDALGLERVAHRHALVDHLDVIGLETLHEGLRAAAGGLDDLDTAIQDDVDVVVVIDLRRHHTHGEIYAEGLVGE